MNQSLLIVDDSQHLHKLVRAHLHEEPIKVHSAFSGEAALSLATELRPSLILLDVDMPDLDGFEVFRRLKANPATAPVAIMFVTADATLTDKVKGLDLGAVDYITKPFKPEELQARVAAAMRARKLLEKSTVVDGLTGVWNPTFLEMNLPAHLSLARRSGRPLSCIVGEVDSADDGETTRLLDDDVIQVVAAIFSSHCRVEDIVCHCGQGKFAVLMPDTSRSGAAHLADRIRLEIERQLDQSEMEIGPTYSFGVADSEGWTDTPLLDRAEAALNRGKETGRNIVSVNRPGRLQN